MKGKPQVGQKVIVNSDRYIGDNPFNQYEVCRVGRKYFYAKMFSLEYQFHIDTWCEKTDYTCRLQAYESIDAYNDEKERREWVKLFSQTFSSRNQFTIAQYRTAARCLDIYLDRHPILKGVAK